MAGMARPRRNAAQAGSSGCGCMTRRNVNDSSWKRKHAHARGEADCAWRGLVFAGVSMAPDVIRGRANRALEPSVAGFEVGGFVQGGAAAFEPVGGPVDDLVEWDLGAAEEAVCEGAVVQQCGVGFGAGEGGVAVQEPAELLGDLADAEGLGAGEV